MPQARASAVKRSPLRYVLLSGALLLAGALLLLGVSGPGGSAAEQAREIPAPASDEPAGQVTTSEVALLAGGCFWGVQGVFQHVEGVTNAVSGYAGGEAALRDGRHGHDRARGIGRDHLRPAPDQLWPHPADLFLRRP